MAILITSPQKKKRLLFWVISILVIAALAFIFGIAFPPFATQSLGDLGGISVPNVKINFDALNSKEVKNLVPFNGEISENQSVIGRDDPFSPYYQGSAKK